MNLKLLIKNLLPTNLKVLLKVIRDRCVLSMAMHQQAKRFFRAYARDNNRNSSCLEARVIFFSHQIEKGLSHKDFRYGFGLHALKNLSSAMINLKEIDPDAKNNIVYRMALSALHEYIQRHTAVDYDLTAVRNLFASTTIWEEAEQFTGLQGGSYVVNSATKIDNQLKCFAELAKDRHAIREFSSAPVTVDEIRQAVDLARTAPSVCNRQPARVHVTCNQNIIEQALRVQGGFRGYSTPPALILVTSDNQSFLFPTERNEGFVDGGLFSMQLLLSLESLGLAACPLNTMMNKTNEDLTRNLMQVPDSEFLVMYIAVGHFPETISLCRSKRLPVGAIMSVID